MACFSPLHAFRGPENANGKRPLIWKAPAGTEKVAVPCGKCIGCRMTYARGMASRCMHEAQVHNENSFVTLTFDDEKLPDGYDGEVHIRDVQLFMKRLRKEYPRKKVRYFFAGEYGGQRGRPHYHGLLFGHDFEDKKLEVTRFGNKVYSSESLSKLWPYGFHSIGQVTYASASYVARYCMKKVGQDLTYYRDEGRDGEEKYQVDKKTGLTKVAEFTLMSRRPGIGASWFEEFQTDVFPSDEVILNGKSIPPPRFYDKLLEKVEPDLLEMIKSEREARVDMRENSDSRLAVKEEVVKKRMEKLVRCL